MHIYNGNKEIGSVHFIYTYTKNGFYPTYNNNQCMIDDKELKGWYQKKDAINACPEGAVVVKLDVVCIDKYDNKKDASWLDGFCIMVVVVWNVIKNLFIGIFKA